MIPTSYPSKEEIARLSARMLLEIGAVNFNTKEPVHSWPLVCPRPAISIVAS